MSVRRQSKNVSFSSFDEGTSFSQVRLNSHRPLQSLSPLRNSFAKPQEMERQNIAPNMYSPLKGVHTVQFLEEEVKRLSDMVFYLGTSKDKLTIENDQQQKQIAYLKICEQKFKEQFQAQVRKLKEMFNDKNSECQSLNNNSRREKQILEKENERIKAYIKSIIEQKNQEIFKLSQEKQRQVDETKNILEETIENLRKQKQDETEKLQIQLIKLQEQVQLLRSRNQKLEKQYSDLNDRAQANLAKIVEEHEEDVRELGQKYHRNKILMLETSQQEVETLQQSSQIQRQAYMFEIESLKRQIQRLTVENQSIKEKQSLALMNFEQNLSDYQVLVAELQQKLGQIHKAKEQELELTKIKTSSLHEDNLKAVQQTYAPRLAFLSDKIRGFEEEITQLQGVLSKEIEKNASLSRKMHLKESKHQEELAKMKLMYDNSQEVMRQKFFSEKSMIMQKSAQMIKNYEMKANSIQFYQEELRKLRKQLQERILENQDRENVYEQEKKIWEAQREQLLSNIKMTNQNSEKMVRELKGLIDDKSVEIDNLSKQILKSIRESPLPDYSHYLEEIDSLKKEVLEKEELIRVGLEKVERAEKKCRQHQQEVEKMRLESDVIINEAKSEWQVLAQEKLNEMEDFFKKKLDFVQDERDELKYLNNELEDKISQLVLRYQELEYALNEIMTSLQRRSDFDQKLILLGTDINLIKNKESLFSIDK